MNIVYIASQAWNVRLKMVLEKKLPNVIFRIAQLDNAKEAGAEAVASVLDITDKDLERLQDAEILIADNNLIPNFAHTLPRLRWLQGTYAGMNIPLAKMAPDLAAGRFPAFKATRFTGESYGQLMFEYCLSFI